MTPEALPDVLGEVYSLLGRVDFNGGAAGHIISRHCEEGFSPTKRSLLSCWGLLRSLLLARNDEEELFIPHPWIKICIQNIGDQVAEDYESRTNDEDRHEKWIVTFDGGLIIQSSHAGPGKYGFDED